MKFDVTVLTYNLSDIPTLAKAAESIGFDGFWLSETNSDPFMALTLAAEHTSRLDLGTAIAVAFPRSPTTLAYLGWDLQRFSNGRFFMGLGPQVRAHNERRFGVKWEKPILKMRETIGAMRVMWDCWQNGTRLNYQGEFFQLDLMTPFFSPGKIDHPHIPVYLAAVNEQMLRLVGEACDGVFLHAFHTAKYLREYALPQIEAGAAKTGRGRADITTNTAVFAVPTDDSKYAAFAEGFAKQQIAFYMSTPAYRVVTEMHGWDETALQLSKLARSGGWAEMPGLITDNILSEMAVSGTWAELPGKIHQRYGTDLIDRISYYLPFIPGENEVGWRASIAEFKALSS